MTGLFKISIVSNDPVADTAVDLSGGPKVTESFVDKTWAIRAEGLENSFIKDTVGPVSPGFYQLGSFIHIVGNFGGRS